MLGSRLKLNRSGAPWFYGFCAACVLAGAAFVWEAPNLIWLTVWAQIVNALLLPMVVGFLVVLATSSLPIQTGCAGGISVSSSSPRRLLAHAACSARSKVFCRRLGAATRSFTLKRGYPTSFFGLQRDCC